MKFNFSILLMLLVFYVSHSQTNNDTVDFIVVMKEGYNLNYSEKTVRDNNYYSFELDNPNLKSFINSKPIYDIKKELPTAKTPYLQRVYRISTNTEMLFTPLNNRTEIEFVEIYTEPIPLNLPDDYTIADDGEKNTALELIRAPMTWGITTGDASTFVGIADGAYEFTHEDLVNKIEQNLNGTTATSTQGGNHGTQVAGMFCESDNLKGSSSLAPEIKIVTAGSGYSNLLLLSQQPGVRVVNASWGTCNSYAPWKEAIIQEIINGTSETPPVVVVGAAGNKYTTHNCNVITDMIYPASFPGVISAGTINHWQPRNTINPNPSIANMFWEDVYTTNIDDPFNPNWAFILNDRIDVLAPGKKVYGPGAPGFNNDDWNGYWRHTGSSFSAPIVCGAVALMLSVNPNLTPAQVRQIIKDTADDIYYIPENQIFPLLQNIGRLNVFRAVTTAKCMLETTESVDLLVRDNEGDYGQEPNDSAEIIWDSPEIWVRNQQDGKRIRKHQNPTYSSTNNTNYMYVRVYNRGCATSSGNDTLKVYWSKASTALSWPTHWDGSTNFPNNGPIMGNLVGEITIPQLERGEDVILEIPWQVPNPDDYNVITPEPWHFCILARIESTDDPMIVNNETSDLWVDVNTNNNIGWKNLTVITIPDDIQESTSETTSISGVIAVGNNQNTSRDFALEIELDNKADDYNKQLFEECEITLNFDEGLFNQWTSGGKLNDNLEEQRQPRTLLVKNTSSKISKITLLPNQVGTVNFKFNFLTKELLNKKGKFVLNVIQRDLVTNRIIGGETFNIEKYQRTPFYAEAGDDKLVNKDELVTFSATQIDKEAVYNWYDEEGNLIYSGVDLQVVADISKKFKLEIVSLEDGLKDYSEVNLDLKNNHIASFYPNPAKNVLNLDLKINHLNNNYIMINGIDSNNSSNVYNYMVNNNSLTIDVSNFANGNYVISFIHNGQVTDSKIFIKN